MSWVIASTPIIVSIDREYVQVKTIKQLAEEKKQYYIWTPFGWDKIISIKQKENSDANEICFINDGKNLLICSKSTKFLSNKYFKFTEVSKELDRFVIPDMHKLIYDYSIDSVGPENPKILLKLPFPQSTVVDFKSAYVDDGCTYVRDATDPALSTAHSYFPCENCKGNIDGSFYVCIKCSSKWYKPERGHWFKICIKCHDECKIFRNTPVDFGKYTICHETSHMVRKIIRPTTTDYYNINDTIFYESKMVESMTNPVNDWTVNKIPYWHIQLNERTTNTLLGIMCYEKLGYTNYSFTYSCQYSNPGLYLQENFYNTLLKKYQHLKPKYKQFLKSYEDNKKSIHNKINRQRKKTTIHNFKIADNHYVYPDLGLPYDMISESTELLIETPMEMFCIETTSKYWHAGVGKLILCNEV